RRPASEGAACKRRAAAGILRTALCVDRNGTTQGVQAEGRIGTRNQLDTRDGGLGDQIPVDYVAERLVDTDTILENGYALRCTEKRRCTEAAKADIRLEGIPLRRIRRESSGILLQVVRDV